MIIIYIDNIARFYTFKKILKSKIKKIDLFICDLPSSYFLLKKEGLKCVIIPYALDQLIKLKLFNINFYSLKNLNKYPIKKIIFWSGFQRDQQKLINNINKKNKIKFLYIENANINNLFQYGEKGINNMHELALDNKKSLSKVVNYKVVKFLKDSIPSDPLDHNNTGREKYNRNFFEILIDVSYKNNEIKKILFSQFYKLLNKFSKYFFNIIKALNKNELKRSNKVECFLCQVHNDTNLISSGINSIKLIKNIYKKNKRKIYLKPHPEDILYALYLRIFLFKYTRFEYGFNIDSLLNENYKIFHTITSSAGVFLASNCSLSKVIYYGKTPFTGRNSFKFVSNYLLKANQLSKIIET